MTKVELEEIKDRVAAATVGPWVFCEGDSVTSHIKVGDWRIDLSHGSYEAWASFVFIAHARTDIPALIARIEHLESSIAKIEQRWREASKDSSFRSHYRGTMAECANELAAVLAGVDDSQLEAEIDKAVEESGS